MQLPLDGDETFPPPTKKGSLPTPTAVEELLTVHRYCSLMGQRSTEQRLQLSATMQASRGTVEVFLYEDQILKNEGFPVEGLQPKTNRELAFLAGVSESYIEKAKIICGFGLVDVILDEGKKFGPVYRNLTDVCRAGLGEELRTGQTNLDALWLQACEARSGAGDSSRHWNPTKRDFADRINELESEIQILRGQLENSARGNIEFTPSALESGNQLRELEEQRDQVIRRAVDVVSVAVVPQSEGQVGHRVGVRGCSSPSVRRWPWASGGVRWAHPRPPSPRPAAGPA